MQRLEVSGAVRPVYGSLGVKWLTQKNEIQFDFESHYINWIFQTAIYLTCILTIMSWVWTPKYVGHFKSSAHCTCAASRMMQLF